MLAGSDLPCFKRAFGSAGHEHRYFIAQLKNWSILVELQALIHQLGNRV